MAYDFIIVNQTVMQTISLTERILRATAADPASGPFFVSE
jgi:hypothetical protein